MSIFDGKNAIISVSAKEGALEFAQALVELGYRIFSTDGTAAHLTEGGVEVIEISTIVGEPLFGRLVKTLSREVAAGLLAPQTAESIKVLAALRNPAPLFQLACVDFYGLEAAIAKEGATLESVLADTDVGGPTMVREAAKGRRIVVCDPNDRMPVIEWLRAGSPDHDTRIHELCAKGEWTVAKYVTTSALYLGGNKYFALLGERVRELCYGENKPQGNAALYTTDKANQDPLALSKFKQVEGNDPSYINCTDVGRSLQTLTHIVAGMFVNFEREPHIAIAVKHGGACGVGVSFSDPNEAVEKMIAGDPEAISGGVVIMNIPIDDHIAQLLRTHLVPEEQDQRVLDSVIGPDATSGAIQVLARTKTGKCRIFTNPALGMLNTLSVFKGRRYTQFRDELLAQDADTFVLKLPDEWKERLSADKQIDLVLGLAICGTSSSNTIVIVKNGMLYGLGISQPSRVLGCRVALLQAEVRKHDVRGAFAVGDSYFPFRDGPEVLANAGITHIWATSGSTRDKETAAVCQEHGIELFQLHDSVARRFSCHSAM